MNTTPPATVDVTPVVIITGAAGGLGGSLVAAFVAANYRVVAGWHRHETLTAGEQVLSVPMDVRQPGQIQAAVSAAMERWGRMDVLINNAGIAADGLVMQMTEEDWDRVMEVNLKGAFLCAQAVARVMCRQRTGHILNVSSFAGRTGAHGQANYAAAKAGLVGLTTSLAREVGARNVRVNAVLPGVLPTGMTANLKPEVMESFANANVLGRINTLDEVARFMVFLAGTQNISGQVFQLDSRIARWG